MAILIDGYNLLNATGIDGRGVAGRTELERSRIALLNFLAQALTADERASTTIVFDAAQAPPGLPGEQTHADMQVRFARGYPTADDFIEELIAADHVPRQLVVVSSDHRLHRAARRRRARAIDSDAWTAQLEARRRSSPSATENYELDEQTSDDLRRIFPPEFFAAAAQDDGAQQAADEWNPFPPGYGADAHDDD